MMRLLSSLTALLLFTASLSAAVPDQEKRVIHVGQKQAAKVGPGEAREALRLQSVTFDPLTEIADYSGVGLSAVPSNGYGIVQFSSGSDAAPEKLEAAGVDLLGYLPDNAFRVRLDARTRRQLDAMPEVRWFGPYLPGYKVHSTLWEGSGVTSDELVIVLFPSENASEVAEKLAAIVPEGMTLRVVEQAWAPRLIVAIPLQNRDELVRAAAELDAVSWIEPWREMRIHNNNALGPVQGNIPSAAGRPIFDHGLTGTGQIVAVADSGADIDMCFFNNLNGHSAVTTASETIAPGEGVSFPTNKVIGYWVQEGADAYDDNQKCGDDSSRTNFHGTHVAGSAVGDNVQNASSPTAAGIDTGDGMAPNAQLLFQDIGNSGGCLIVHDELGLMFKQAFNGGARLHNNSWGGDTAGDYTILDAEADRFLFENEEMAIFTSAGNSGPDAKTVGTPGVSKNVITVGALGSGTSTTIASFSSRGPVSDGRIKPDLLAPGTSIISASGDATSGNGNCGTRSSSGTSMASPIATGAAALLRQYFTEGFYPTGARNELDSFEPTGTLLKAMLLNGTLPLPADGEFGGQSYGWGRIFLDSNMYFSGDDRDSRVFDLPNSQGIRTGQSHSYEITVEPGQELRATLVWFDAEATLGAAKALVNNLDLSVSGAGSIWRGNVLNPTGLSMTGGDPDTLNTVEQVRLSAPAGGTYTVTVNGKDIPGNGRSKTNRQGYALVVSSKQCASGVVAAPVSLTAGTNPTFGIDLSWSPAAGSTRTQVYRAIAGENDFSYIGSSTTGSFTDDRAQGGVTYVYRVRGSDGCGEGPLSSALTVQATGACDLQPEFSGVIKATAGSPDCQITLEWAPATAGCTLGDGVLYNIYRTTDRANFPSEPIASVRNVTRFDDIDIDSGVTYHYIVRAEDRIAGGTGPNGGNEEDNSVVRSAIAVGAPGDLGTWTDDAGDTSALLVGELPWDTSSAQAQSGNKSYYAGIGGSYPSDTCASLVTPELQLGAAASLQYWTRYDLEWQWDGVVVEISTDGGANWSNLAPDGGYPTTLAQTQNPPVNACGYSSTQGAFTGPQTNGALTPWTASTSDLSAFAGQSVRIRWRLTTDPGAAFEGFYLDTISITNVALPGDCQPVIVNPEAGFALQTRSPVDGAPVAFSDQSSGNPTSWTWNFGDGGTSTAQNPTHTYSDPGRYDVTLTVSNSAGSASISRPVYIFDMGLSYEPQMIIPGQARAEGGNGSFFRSAFWMTNLSAGDTAVRLRYLPTPAGAAGNADESILIAIAPGESVAFSDVLTEALGADSNTGGALIVEVGEGLVAPVVTARTYNEPSAFSGSFGQYIPAVRLNRTNGLSIQMDGLGGDTESRSNIGVVNLTDSAITASITVVDSSGTVLGSPVPVSLAPFSATQVNRINVAAGAGALATFSVRINGTGRFFAYASKLDNTTSDPIFVPDSLEPQSEQWIDGVGATPGGGNTFFRSNLSLANRGAAAAEVTIDYLPRGASTPAATKKITLPAGETAFFSDSLTEIFSLEGAGLYRISTPAETPVVAWARTFNDRGALGTLGQFIPGFGESELIGPGGAILQGLSDDESYRTNLGLVNVGTSAVGITVEVWNRDGSKAAEKAYFVASGQTAFIGRALRAIAGKDVSNGYLIIRPASSGSVYAWASYVDNRSTDQTFVRPLPVP